MGNGEYPYPLFDEESAKWIDEHPLRCPVAYSCGVCGLFYIEGIRHECKGGEVDGRNRDIK